MQMILWSMILTTMIIFFLISLSFSTIFERKTLSIYNFRLGPMKSFMGGIMIPFSDFLKLFSKFFKSFFFVDLMYYKLFLGLFIFIWILNMYPMFNSLHSFIYSIMMIFLSYSVMIYYMFFLGWSSKSKYSYIASFRILIQSISYEVGFIFSFLMILFMWKEFDLFNLFNNGKNFLLSIIFSSIWMMFIFSEMGRSPFDFVEGESELVSGFNIEYMGGMFSMIFMIEYGMMIFISMIISFIMFGSNLIFMYVFFLFCFIRCCFPRLRYDKMMYLFWKDYLFFVVMVFIFLSFFY